MGDYSRDDYNSMAARKRRSFTLIADALGKEHAITKMMGSLAWGRHRMEQGPQGNLRTAVAEYGFLEGFFDALNLWARDHDRQAQVKMLKLWSGGMSGKDKP